MEIKFIELLPKTRPDLYEALFKIGNKDIKIGISYSLMATWRIERAENSVMPFLQKFGPLQIQLMLAEDCLNDYKFTSDKFKKADGSSIKYEELENHLNSKILEAKEKSKSIGFKIE